MKRKTLICMLIGMLTLSLGIWNVSYADDLQDQMDEVNQQKEEVSAEMSQLTEKVENAQNEVDEIQKNIDQTQAEINVAEAEIEQTKAAIAERQQGLNQRLRTMYKNGSVGYLDVLLGSNSISEFLNNLEMIQRIYRNDQDTLVELETQHGILEEKQIALENEKAELDQEMVTKQEKQEELESSQAALQEKLDALTAEAEALSAEIAEQQRLAEERRRQEEAEREQQQQQEGNSESQEEEYNENTGVGTGQFIWPCDSRLITSEFGYRYHPLTGIWTGHTGMDIGCSMYDPVYASDSGTVILSGWYGGYGYAVVIDHGDGLSTLYGHNEELHVSVGEKVSQGEVIASAGSTGWSTGPHVHFEVRVNGECVDPRNYL